MLAFAVTLGVKSMASSELSQEACLLVQMSFEAGSLFPVDKYVDQP